PVSSSAHASHRPLPSFPTRRSSDLSSSPPPLQAARVRDTTATPATAPSTFFLLMVVLHDRSDGFWAGRHAGAPRWRTEQLPLHRSEEHTSELQSRFDLVCRLLLEKT